MRSMVSLPNGILLIAIEGELVGGSKAGYFGYFPCVILTNHL